MAYRSSTPTSSNYPLTTKAPNSAPMMNNMMIGLSTKLILRTIASSKWSHSLHSTPMPMSMLTPLTMRRETWLPHRGHLYQRYRWWGRPDDTRIAMEVSKVVARVSCWMDCLASSRDIYLLYFNESSLSSLLLNPPWLSRFPRRF